MIIFAVLDRIDPFHQPFALTNISLQYPYAVKQRVSPVLLAFIAGVIPFFLILGFTFVLDGLFSHQRSSRGRLSRYTLRERLWEANAGVLGLLLSISFSIVVTGALKNAVGKPRPDVIDRCQPSAGSSDAPGYGLATIGICTQTDKSTLQDGFRSFPSGHSSTAFAGLFYLSLWFAGKLHVLDRRGESWKTFIVLIPTLGAALIAASRIMDARHHPFDVLFGSLLGILTAWGAYRQYFPSVAEPRWKGRAYPLSAWGKFSAELENTERNLDNPTVRADTKTDSNTSGSSHDDQRTVPAANDVEAGPVRRPITANSAANTVPS
jgi:diacylglycerol diphosphate phosphatase/phosphatidate phosphatase